MKERDGVRLELKSYAKNFLALAQKTLFNAETMKAKYESIPWLMDNLNMLHLSLNIYHSSKN